MKEAPALIPRLYSYTHAHTHTREHVHGRKSDIKRDGMKRPSNAERCAIFFFLHLYSYLVFCSFLSAVLLCLLFLFFFLSSRCSYGDHVHYASLFLSLYLCTPSLGVIALDIFLRFWSVEPRRFVEDELSPRPPYDGTLAPREHVTSRTIEPENRRESKGNK